MNKYNKMYKSIVSLSKCRRFTVSPKSSNSQSANLYIHKYKAMFPQ